MITSIFSTPPRFIDHAFTLYYTLGVRGQYYVSSAAARAMQVVRVIPARVAHCERHEEVNEVSVAWREQQRVVTVVVKKPAARSPRRPPALAGPLTEGHSAQGR